MAKKAIEHEHRLIDTRLQRYFTIQGFLFTAIAAAIAGFYMFPDTKMLMMIIWLLLAGIAISTSHVIEKSITSANRQTYRISLWFEKCSNDWLNFHALAKDQKKVDAELQNHMDRFVVSINPKHRFFNYFLGDTSTIMYPRIFKFAWLILIVVLLIIGFVLMIGECKMCNTICELFRILLNNESYSGLAIGAGTILAGSIALFQWRHTVKVKRLEMLNKLLDVLRSKEVNSARESIDNNKFRYTKEFHGTEEEANMDRYLSFVSVHGV